MKLKKHFELHVPKTLDDDFEEDEESVNDDVDQDDDADDDSDSYENLDDVLSDQPDDDESGEEYEDYEATTRYFSFEFRQPCDLNPLDVSQKPVFRI